MILTRARRRLDRVLARGYCRFVGHDPCWIWGAALGFKDRPVCSRCWDEL